MSTRQDKLCKANYFMHKNFLQPEGKMNFQLILLVIFYVYGTSAVSIMPELKCNVLKFGYGVNFKHEGMLLHSFDRYHVVVKIEIPKISDLQLSMFQFDYNCSHITNMQLSSKQYPTVYKKNFLAYCKKIIPYVYLYQRQAEYYNQTAYELLANGIGLILPKFNKNKRQKRQIISALVSGFIGLAYEGISTYLHHRREKALHKAVWTINKRVDLERNRVLSFRRFNGNVWCIYC